MQKNFTIHTLPAAIPKAGWPGQRTDVIWKVMRISMIQITLAMIFTGMVIANENYAQKVLDREVNFSVKAVKLKKVLREIEATTKVKFVYSRSYLGLNEEISMEVAGEKLGDVLEQLLAPREIAYRVQELNDYIVLTPETHSTATFQEPTGTDVAEFADITVTGKVTDVNGITIPGVSILVKGTNTGTVTDVDGQYSVNAPDAEAILIFSSIGYSSQEIAVNGRTVIDVMLAEDVQNLEEVVVVGYGTANKATITGALSTVSGDKLTVAKSANFTNSLVGRLPGLVAVTRSGLPGSDDATLRIRGNNTLNNNSPLIVVDGIANRSMSRLDAADIESVTILKDASAAIYGAQAANGVILITTKRGSTGKLKINATFNQGFSAPTVLPKMADSYLYANMINEMDTYAGQTPRFTAEDIQKFKDGSDPWGHPNTDWFAEVFKPFSLENAANMNLSGGTESLRYYVSIGRKYQDATYRKSGANYSQVDFRSNIDAKVSNNINFSIDVSGRQENRNYSPPTTNSPFRLIARGKPSDVAWWFNGLPGPDVESDENPVVMVTNIPGYDKDTRYILQSNMKLNINIPWVKGLSVTGNASIDKGIGIEKIWRVPYYLYVWDGVTLDDTGLPELNGSKRGISQPRLDQKMGNGQRITLNALINYNRRIGEKHEIKFLAGSESSVGDSLNFSALRKYFVSSAIDEFFAGGDLEKDNNGSASESARLNYFGRVNYDYLSKYLLEFVWRYDGSYIFPADKRWGFFPGFSVGWVLSEENFLKNRLTFLNYFKIRGSWGQTGNDRISNFQYLSTYGFGGNILNLFNGNEWVLNENVKNKVLLENRIPNLNVTWEIANQTNVGFDAQLLGGKLKLEGDYFYNLRTNILAYRNASVPQSTGLKLPSENIGEVVNRGFEFVVGYGDERKNFGYNVSLNGGYAKNKIKFWDETPGIPEYQQTTGHPMNSQLYYQAIGIFKDQAAVDAYPHWVGARPGDVIFKDVNDDGKINGLDRVRDYRSDIPTFTTGLNIDLTYKNFYATVLFQGAFGKIRYHRVESGEAGNYYMEDAEGRWTEDNPNATKPRTFNYTSEYWGSQLNTYWLRNADYVRLKNIEIGYNLPSSIISKLGVNAFRVYVGGMNLVTWSPGLKSFDPESIYQDYPLSKVINVGASLTF